MKQKLKYQAKLWNSLVDDEEKYEYLRAGVYREYDNPSVYYVGILLDMEEDPTEDDINLYFTHHLCEYLSEDQKVVEHKHISSCWKFSLYKLLVQ